MDQTARFAVCLATDFKYVRRLDFLLVVNDRDLLSEFVGAFRRLDTLRSYQGVDPAAWALRTGKSGRFGAPWRPRPVRVSPRSLERLNRLLPNRFPPLFETLLTTYRWAAVDIETCALLASPPGPGLRGFEKQLFGDRFLTGPLLSAGFVQFARVSGGSYDPVCFDFSSLTGSREARIVSLDHEAILCQETVVVRDQIALSFRQLVLDTIAAASQKRR